ncbi:MAG TPA: hypothetical protein VF152_06090 [Acidimicrobiia bacterium]
MFRAVGPLLAGIALTVATPGLAAADREPRHQVAGPTQAAILVDPQSGAILEAQGEHEALPVAGAVKLVTALTAVQRIALEDRVLTTATAVNAPEPTLGMREDTLWQLEDLLQAMLLSGHNDAAYALAEAAGGSIDGFAAEMARVGALMGLEDSTFGDPAGTDQDAAPGGGTRMSAYDLAVVAANVLATPELAEIVALFDYRVVTPDGVETGLRESNNSFIRAYQDATGMITSSSPAAGEIVVASATREGRSLVAVVLNAGNADGVAAGLLDRGFATDPEAEGTGEHLPDARVTSLQGRLIALTGVPRPLGAPAISAGGARGPGAPVADAPTPRPRPPAAATDDGGGGGFPFLKVLALLAAAGLVVAVAYRHRAVQRERVHRQARERHLADARRRGTLDVVEPDVAADPTEIKIVRR